MLMAQISDTHIATGGQRAYGIVDTAGLLRACVADVVRLDPRPDLVVLTGDLVDHGRPEEYALLQELLAPLTLPLYLVAGNHDEREALRSTLAGPRFDYLGQTGEFLQYAVDLGPLRLLVLDTVVPQEGRGQLCRQRLAWLEQRLAEDDRPTVIAMHHPPFATGIAHMDALALEGADALPQPPPPAPPSSPCTIRRSPPALPIWTPSGWKALTRWRNCCASTRRSSACCAAICTAPSSAASGARWPPPVPAPRTRWRWTCAPTARTASCWSRPVTNCTCGMQAGWCRIPAWLAHTQGLTGFVRGCADR